MFEQKGLLAIAGWIIYRPLLLYKLPASIIHHGIGYALVKAVLHNNS